MFALKNSWQTAVEKLQSINRWIDYRMHHVNNPWLMVPFFGFVGAWGFEDRAPSGSLIGMIAGMGFYGALYLLQKNGLFPFAEKVYLPTPVAPKVRKARWLKGQSAQKNSLGLNELVTMFQWMRLNGHLESDLVGFLQDHFLDANGNELKADTLKRNLRKRVRPLSQEPNPSAVDLEASNLFVSKIDSKLHEKVLNKMDECGIEFNSEVLDEALGDWLKKRS